MADQNAHINYSLSDIERYLSGKMLAGEMHDIEKAAMQDPFLADALEGYAKAPLQLAARHLNQIAASLQQNKQDSMVAPIARSSWQWWKIAAIVIVIAGAGALAYQVMQPGFGPGSEANKELAQHEAPASSTETPQPQHTPALIPVSSDTVKPAEPQKITAKVQVQPSAWYNNENRQQKAHSSKDAPLLSYNQKKETANPVAAEMLSLTPVKILADTISVSQNLNEVVVSGYATMRKADAASAIEGRVPGVSVDKNTSFATSYKLSGTITDANGKPVTGATVKAVNGHAFSITDDKGRFAVKAMDSTAKVEIASVGFETTVASVSATKNNIISLEEEGESLSDMVVTELHTRTKAKEQAKKATTDTLYPDGGWQSFQEYVYKKIHQEMDTTGANQEVSGEIELEFAIDEQGNPHHLKVIKSFNNNMNGKAISAVENGPKWIGDKKRKGRVIVRF